MADILTIEHDERISDDAVNYVDNAAEKQGNAFQWISENRQLNDYQLFAHVTAEVQSALSSALKTERIGFPEGSNAFGKHHGRRAAKKIDFGHVEVQLTSDAVHYEQNSKATRQCWSTSRS